ncbi:MAG TPA: MFS transporter [Gemmatimonadaceae bacterium]|nr:MFS transporter [Gemmatimonadaceae bacterium]
MTHSPHPDLVMNRDVDVGVSRAPAVERWSWALYDFSNTIFSMNIATLFFAVWLIDDIGASNTMAALATSISSVLVVCSIPLFGAISDATQRRKPWVVGFTLISVVMVITMGIIGQTMVPLIGEAVKTPSVTSYALAGFPAFAILTAFILANWAYQGAMPFYNAMMFELAPPHEIGRLSGIGTGLGYIGSIVGVLLVSPFFNGAMPIVGSLPDNVMSLLRKVPFTANAGRVSTFVPTALLFLLFSLPLFLFCRDHNIIAGTKRIAWKEAFAGVVETIRDSKKYPGALRFLLASFLYQDAIGTIIGYMAIYAVKAMGFEKGSEVTLFVVLTVPAAVGSFFIGRLVDRIGPKKSLVFVITGWVILLIAMIVVPNRLAFWLVGGGIGLIFGGVATAERPLLLTLVPDVEAARFFSLMVLSSRAAAIAGPLIWGWTVDGFLPSFGVGFAYRAAVVTVVVSMFLSLVLLWKVPDKWRKHSPA